MRQHYAAHADGPPVCGSIASDVTSFRATFVSNPARHRCSACEQWLLTREQNERNERRAEKVEKAETTGDAAQLETWRSVHFVPGNLGTTSCMLPSYGRVCTDQLRHFKAAANACEACVEALATKAPEPLTPPAVMHYLEMMHTRAVCGQPQDAGGHVFTGSQEVLLAIRSPEYKACERCIALTHRSRGVGHVTADEHQPPAFFSHGGDIHAARADGTVFRLGHGGVWSRVSLPPLPKD